MRKSQKKERNLIAYHRLQSLLSDDNRCKSLKIADNRLIPDHVNFPAAYPNFLGLSDVFNFFIHGLDIPHYLSDITPGKFG